MKQGKQGCSKGSHFAMKRMESAMPAAGGISAALLGVHAPLPIRPCWRALRHVCLKSGPAYTVSVSLTSHHQRPSRQRCSMAEGQQRLLGHMHVRSFSCQLHTIQLAVACTHPWITATAHYNPCKTAAADLPVNVGVPGCVHSSLQSRLQRLPPVVKGRIWDRQGEEASIACLRWRSWATSCTPHTARFAGCNAALHPAASPRLKSHSRRA